MIKFKVKTSENNCRFDVKISAIETEIRREYEESTAKDLIRMFHDMMLGSTVSKVNDEIVVYPHDIAAIFAILAIPIKFIDGNGNELAINANDSGIVATTQNFD